MGQVVSLKIYKQNKRTTYLKRFGGRIERFIGDYIRNFASHEYTQIQHYFSASQWSADFNQWDYWDYREMLSEALDRVIAPSLFSALKSEWWFSSELIGHEEILDRCVGLYILSLNEQKNPFILAKTPD
ncbi:MAG: hypothetical protein KBD78_11190 [Oligoflexales bacterium]|nr:hypothetical protein [Oligoflexales bacterium]